MCENPIFISCIKIRVNDVDYQLVTHIFLRMVYVEEKSDDEDDEEIPGDPIKINKGKFMRPLTEVKDMGPTIKIINKQLQKLESIFIPNLKRGRM